MAAHQRNANPAPTSEMCKDAHTRTRSGTDTISIILKYVTASIYKNRADCENTALVGVVADRTMALNGSVTQHDASAPRPGQTYIMGRRGQRTKPQQLSLKLHGPLDMQVGKALLDLSLT
jgi:hypothetical protein